MFYIFCLWLACAEADDAGLLLLQTRAVVTNASGLIANSSANSSNSTANTFAPDPGTQGMLPIFVSYNGVNHVYHESEAVPPGYVLQGISFYARPHPGAGAVPIYAFWEPQLLDTIYQQSPDAPDDDYVGQGVAFYAFAVPEANTVPIHGFYNADLLDHSYQVSSLAPEGYSSKGVQFYAYSRPPAPQILTCAAPLSLGPGTLVQNNLAGHGPDSGDAWLRFADVATVDGSSIDLIVTSPDYVRPAGSKNGYAAGSDIWRLDQKPNTTTTLQFNLVNASAAGLNMSLAKLDRVSITFYNVDGKRYGNLTESLDICNVDDVFLSSRTSLREERLGDDCTRLSPVNLTNGPAPTDPTNLSDAQTAHSFTAVLSSASFTLSTSLSPGTDTRSLLFAGVHAIGSFC